MAGVGSRARDTEQEHGPAGDERHLAEPSDDSRAHLGTAADAPEEDDAASSGNPSADFSAVFIQRTKRLELVLEPDRITRPEVNAATRQSQRLELRRANTLGCISPHATQKTSRFPRSLSDTAEKTGEENRRKKGANRRRNEVEQAGVEMASSDDIMQLVANGTDTESDAAMPLMPNGTHRGEGAVENGAQDKGDDMTDSELED